MAQGDIRISGYVELTPDLKPLKGVAISVNGIFKCYSDDGGNFSLIVPRDAILELNHPECEIAQVMVEGRQDITVALRERIIEIEGVVVSSTIRRNFISVEPTIISVDDGYLKVATKFYVPSHLFRSDHRFAAQGLIVDRDVDTAYLLRPVVVDGERYHQTQNRWLNFGASLDSLSIYVVDNNLEEQGDIYHYRDSLYVGAVDQSLTHDYIAECHLALVSYHEPPIFVDTVTIARGLVDPMRHFECDIAPMQLDGSILRDGQEPYLMPRGRDTIYIPAYEMELQQMSGEAKISFEINRSTIDYSRGDSRAEIEAIQSMLLELQSDPNVTIRTIKLCGYASPEGSYSRNLRLAKDRTEHTLGVILSILDPLVTRYINLEVNSRVEGWDRVAQLSERDHPELSAKLLDIIQRAKGDHNVINSQVMRLAEYRQIIVPLYLEELRRVSYSIDYTIYKPLPYDVVKLKYLARETLSRYEYYTLIINEQDELLREAMEMDALVAYPNYAIFANRAAIRAISSSRADLELLSPIIEEGYAPLSILYNQAIMALMVGEVEQARRLYQQIAGDDQYIELYRSLLALEGSREGAYPHFEGEESLNRVILLLAMNRDREAVWVMERIMRSYENQLKANYCYIYAICANRVEDLNSAMIYLQLALEIDPTYESLVCKDGDLVDLYEMMQYSNGDGYE